MKSHADLNIYVYKSAKFKILKILNDKIKNS